MFHIPTDKISKHFDQDMLRDTRADESHTIFNCMPMPLCLVNTETEQICFANSAFLSLLKLQHYSSEKIHFLNADGESLSVESSPLVRAARRKIFHNEEFILKTSKNISVHVLISSQMYPELYLDQTVALLCLQDITAKKEIEKSLHSSQEQLSQALKTSKIGFWSADPATGLTTVSPLMAEDWGLAITDQPISAETIMNAIHPDDRVVVWSSVEKALLYNVPYFAEYRVIRPNGDIIWVEGRGEYFKDAHGVPYRFSGTSININEKVLARQRIEYEMQQQKELVEKLRVAQEKAENANKTKSVFLANVSHEIRTPLSAILGFSDLLKERALSETERNQFIEIINRNGKSLIKIVDDVLDLTKVEANCLELEKLEFSLPQLMTDVVELFKEKAKAKNIYLILDIQNELPQTLLSDSVRLRQILTNLISNAVKFTQNGGVIMQVKSKIYKHTEAAIEIKITDTGIGLTEDQKNRLFSPFAQAEISTSRKFGGTGLGLVLSKRLAEALGGDLILEEYEKDCGCTFKFTFSAEFPSRQATSDLVGKKETAAQLDFVPLSGQKILLAEDSLDNQFFIEKFLTKNGAIVTVADNGLDVLEFCAKEKFDAVLMDIEMPQMNGYEATKALRERGFKKPIIALTAHAMTEERIKTREAGCDGHLTKPFDTHQLLLALENCLKIKSRRSS